MHARHDTLGSFVRHSRHSIRGVLASTSGGAYVRNPSARGSPSPHAPSGYRHTGSYAPLGLVGDDVAEGAKPPSRAARSSLPARVKLRPLLASRVRPSRSLFDSLYKQRMNLWELEGNTQELGRASKEVGYITETPLHPFLRQLGLCRFLGRVSTLPAVPRRLAKASNAVLKNASLAESCLLGIGL